MFLLLQNCHSNLLLVFLISGYARMGMFEFLDGGWLLMGFSPFFFFLFLFCSPSSVMWFSIFILCFHAETVLGLIECLL